MTSYTQFVNGSAAKQMLLTNATDCRSIICGYHFKCTVETPERFAHCTDGSRPPSVNIFGPDRLFTFSRIGCGYHPFSQNKCFNNNVTPRFGRFTNRPNWGSSLDWLCCNIDTNCLSIEFINVTINYILPTSSGS